MKDIDGQKFIFDATARVPKGSEDGMARSILRSFQRLNIEGSPLYMGRSSPAGKMLAAERLLLPDGTPYTLVRAVTNEENDKPTYVNSGPLNEH